MKAFRFALKLLAVPALIVLIPALAWWVWNRIDEAPTPLAQRWFAPLPHAVPDAGNAWLYALGLGAAENEDPIALGRRIVEAHDAREAKPTVWQRKLGDAETALRKGALPFARAPGTESFKLMCDFGHDCVQWALDASATLDALARANATRLARYETLLGFRHYEDFATPAVDAPWPDIAGDVYLYRALILRDLGDPARRTAALTRLARATAFARMAVEQAGEMKGIWARFLNQHVRVLDHAIDHTGAVIAAEPAWAAAADAALQPPGAAQFDYEGSMRREAIAFLRLTNAMAPGTLDVLRHCTQDCLKTWLLAQAYAPQATANFAAEFFELRREAYAADPRLLDTALTRIDELWERGNVLSHDMGQMLRAFAFNFTGRTLVLIEQPAFANEMNLRHDHEALRRLYHLKLGALARRIAPKDMPAFLAAQPEDLRNPWTGETFEWDAAAGELGFAPKAKAWKRDVLTVRYPRAE